MHRLLWSIFFVVTNRFCMDPELMFLLLYKVEVGLVFVTLSFVM